MPPFVEYRQLEIIFYRAAWFWQPSIWAAPPRRPPSIVSLPGAYGQYVKFGGETLGSDVEEARAFKGNLLELMWTVSRFIESSFTEKSIFEAGLRERVIWDYPPEAMREFLVNAVLHWESQSNSAVRFYFFPNRIKIQNVVGLYGRRQKRKN